jgi:glc operon protein GlcG
MSLTLQQAEAVVAAARRHAAVLGLDVAIAVLDRRGDDVLVVRMDGARYTGFEVARGKALVSATFGRPSADMTAMGEAPVGRRVNALNHERMVYSQGAVPLELERGRVVGAIGVSGAQPSEDEEIAAAGAAALGEGESEAAR